METKSVKLETLCNVSIGRTPPRAEQYWFNSGEASDWPWLSIKDMGASSKHISLTSETITSDGQKKFNIPVVKKGTVLVSFKLTVGRVSIADCDMLTNEAIAQLPIINNEELDRDFLYYYLKTYPWNTLGSTSSIATAVNSKMIKAMEITYPKDITIQKKIVSILNSIDEKIELNNKMNTNLEEQAEAFFTSMFPNVTEENRIIGDYIVPQRGIGLIAKDAIPGNVPVVAGGLEPACYHNKANTKAPVITISASGANAGFVRLWHTDVWSSDSSYIDSKMSKNVYFWYVMLKKRQKEIFDAQTGSAQPHIYPKHIAIMPICTLNKEEIEFYTDQVKPMFEKIGQNKEEIKNLEELRDALLPKLMSGEIDVEDLDI